MTERTSEEGNDSESVSRVFDGPLPPREILEADEIYDALCHRRRRYLCYTLLEDTEWSLTDLATKVAAWERDVPEHEVPARQRERVYTALYHVHVPKLVDLGVVTFGGATDTITAAENAEQVLAALEGIGTSVDVRQEDHARGEMDDR